jgi:hypothetical protein
MENFLIGIIINALGTLLADVIKQLWHPFPKQQRHPPRLVWIMIQRRQRRNHRKQRPPSAPNH